MSAQKIIPRSNALPPGALERLCGPICSLAPDGSAHGPISRKLWPFESTPGHPSHFRYAIFSSHLGSRPGGNIAAAWGVMNMIGHQGYVEQAKKVIGKARQLRDAARKMDGLDVVGNPEICIVSFSSTKFNIYALLSEMKTKTLFLCEV